MAENENDKIINRTSQSCAKSKIFAPLVVLSGSNQFLKSKSSKAQKWWNYHMFFIRNWVN